MIRFIGGIICLIGILWTSCFLIAFTVPESITETTYKPPRLYQSEPSPKTFELIHIVSTEGWKKDPKRVARYVDLTREKFIRARKFPEWEYSVNKYPELAEEPLPTYDSLKLEEFGCVRPPGY